MSNCESLTGRGPSWCLSAVAREPWFAGSVSAGVRHCSESSLQKQFGRSKACNAVWCVSISKHDVGKPMLQRNSRVCLC